MVFDTLWSFLSGSIYSLLIVGGSVLLGCAIGLPAALLQAYGPTWARFCVRLYVWVFRGIPALVMLFLFYYTIFPSLGIDSDLGVAITALGIRSAAYQSQFLFGALVAIPPGQLSAAKALGMSAPTAIVSILLPQAVRHALPAWSNEYSIVLKDSAIAYAVGIRELMLRAKSVAVFTGQYLPYIALAGVLYWLMTAMGIDLLRRLEKKLRIPGFERAGQ